MRSVKIAETAEYKDIKYYIKRIEYGEDNIYHTGYIRCLEGESLLVQAFEEHEEITFSEIVTEPFKDARYIGFDTAHYYNYQHPETQTFDYVKHQIFNIIDRYEELIAEFTEKELRKREQWKNLLTKK